MRDRSLPAALVSGASSGIGRAIAQRLARDGHDVFLVARDAPALEEAARDLRTRFDVRAETFPCDLSASAAGSTAARRALDADFDIGILVNNAGFTIHRTVNELDTALEHRLVDLQVKATIELTNALLPTMQNRNSGRILNVSSVYAACPAAEQAVYGACKAFIHSYSAALAEELRGSGITVTLLAAGSTRTRLRERADLRLDPQRTVRAMPAEQVAEEAVQGMLEGRLEVVPGLANKLFYGAVGRLPLRLKTRLLRKINAHRLERRG